MDMSQQRSVVKTTLIVMATVFGALTVVAIVLIVAFVFMRRSISESVSQQWDQALKESAATQPSNP
jgi:ssDNA-specific exonuclease RecJ